LKIPNKSLEFWILNMTIIWIINVINYMSRYIILNIRFIPQLYNAISCLTLKVFVNDSGVNYRLRKMVFGGQNFTKGKTPSLAVNSVKVLMAH